MIIHQEEFPLIAETYLSRASKRKLSITMNSLGKLYFKWWNISQASLMINKYAGEKSGKTDSDIKRISACQI